MADHRFEHVEWQGVDSGFLLMLVEVTMVIIQLLLLLSRRRRRRWWWWWWCRGEIGGCPLFTRCKRKAKGINKHAPSRRLDPDDELDRRDARVAAPQLLELFAHLQQLRSHYVVGRARFCRHVPVSRDLPMPGRGRDHNVRLRSLLFTINSRFPRSNTKSTPEESWSPPLFLEECRWFYFLPAESRSSRSGLWRKIFTGCTLVTRRSRPWWSA